MPVAGLLPRQFAGLIRNEAAALRGFLPSRGLWRGAWLAGGSAGPASHGAGLAGLAGAAAFSSIQAFSVHPWGRDPSPSLRGLARQSQLCAAAGAVGSAQVRKGFRFPDIPLGQWPFPGHADRDRSRTSFGPLHRLDYSGDINQIPKWPAGPTLPNLPLQTNFIISEAK